VSVMLSVSYAECQLCLVSDMFGVENVPVKLNVIMLNVIILGVVILNVV
jgi:hypothetical protein